MEELADMKREHKRKGRQRGAWYGESGIWFLSRKENASIKTPYHLILRYLQMLSGLGYLEEHQKGVAFRVFHNAPKWPRVQAASRNTSPKPGGGKQIAWSQKATEAMNKRKEEQEQRRLRLMEEKEAHYAWCEKVLEGLLNDGVQHAQICSYCHRLTDNLDASQCFFCEEGALAPVELSDDYVRSYPHRIRCRPAKRA